MGRSLGGPREARREVVRRPLVGVLSIGCVVVPCLFTTRVPDIFVVPKLAGLWAMLSIGMLFVAGCRLAGQPSGAPLRWVPVVDIAGISLLALNVLAAWRSTDPGQSLVGERLQYQGLLTVLLYAGLFLLARHAVSDARQLTLLFSGLTAGAVLVAGYAILQRTGIDPFWRGSLPEGRVVSTFGQPNALAAYLVLAVGPALSLLRLATGRRRILLAFATVVIVGALLLTLSRGGFVALLVLLVASLALLRFRRRLAGSVVALAVGAVASVLLLTPAREAATGAWREFASRSGGEGEQSIQNHVDLWHVGARIAADNPLLGTGQETFPDVFPRYSREVLPAGRVAYFDAFRVESAHNVYVTTAAVTGIPALLAYLTAIAGSLLVLLRAANATQDRARGVCLLGAAIAALAHLTSDLFMTAEVTSSGLFWMLLGAALGVATSSPPSRDRRGEGAEVDPSL